MNHNNADNQEETPGPPPPVETLAPNQLTVRRSTSLSVAEAVRRDQSRQRLNVLARAVVSGLEQNFRGLRAVVSGLEQTSRGLRQNSQRLYAIYDNECAREDEFRRLITGDTLLLDSEIARLLDQSHQREHELAGLLDQIHRREHELAVMVNQLIEENIQRRLCILEAEMAGEGDFRRRITGDTLLSDAEIALLLDQSRQREHELAFGHLPAFVEML